MLDYFYVIDSGNDRAGVIFR